MAKTQVPSTPEPAVFKLDPRVPLVLGAVIFASGAEAQRHGYPSGVALLALGLMLLLPAALYRFFHRPTVGASGQGAPRYVRRAVVVASYACLLLGLSLYLFAPVEMPSVVSLAIGAGGLVLLGAIIRTHLTWGNARSGDLDIYQRAHRSHATAIAYGAILACSWVLLFTSYLARISLNWDQVGACVLVLALLAITGPGAVLAWLEPEFSDE